MVSWGHEGHVRAGGEHQAAKDPTALWHGQGMLAGVHWSVCCRLPAWVPLAAAVSI